MSQFEVLFGNQDLANAGVPELQHWQQQSWHYACAEGLPNHNHEDWKYTSLAFLHETKLQERQRSKCTAQQLKKIKLDIDATTLVFVDGKLEPRLSDTDIGQWQVTPMVETQLSGAVRPEVFQQLNQAMAQEALMFSLPSGCVTNKPLYLLHINTCTYGGMQHYYHQVDIADNGDVAVIEHHVALNNAEQNKDMYTSRLVMKLGNNSRLRHHNLISHHDQTHHFSHNDVRLGRDSRFESFSFLLSGALIRHHTSCDVEHENSYVRINSLTLPSGEQTYDSRSFVHHQACHCESEQLHKNILQDEACAVFDGMIEVARNAIKIDAQMDNHNLLLSERAQVNSKPQLEIYADDVKCSHGSTTGALDKNQLFYLMARGISKTQALRTLVFAFAAEVLEDITVPEIQKILISLISTKLERK